MSEQSGTEERQMRRTVGFRALGDDVAAIEEVCAEGESPGQLARRLVMAYVARHLTLRRRRRHRRRRPEGGVLAAILGDLGKIGSNINQIARVANASGAMDPAEVRAALGPLDDMRTRVAEALRDA